MALNLSESRRRNFTAGQLLSPPLRISSGMSHNESSYSPGTTRGQLRQYLNEQRGVSRNISPFGGKNSPRHHVSMSGQRRVSELPHDPSPATWARVAQFRSFIELRIEYLRLLEFLPPLKPDSSAPGNFIVTANNVPGSPHAQLTRVPSYMNKQYDLGRPYNPLQVLRNRRCRARERKAFNHQPEEFSDPVQIQKWVDGVEMIAQSPMYRQMDVVALPKIHGDHDKPVEPAKPPRPNKVWMFTNEELLADALWLEDGDNKTIVEDRYGRKIFPVKEQQKQDLLQPRVSKEYPEKRRKSWVDGLPGVAGDPTTGDESEPLSERGRKRRLLPTFRAESPKHRKHIWGGSKPEAGNYTDSSDSDSDVQKDPTRKNQKVVDVDNNTGPLALRMKQLMETEAKEAQGSSQTPTLITPDTPNKWGHDHADVYNQRNMRHSAEISDSANGSANTNAEMGWKFPPKQRIDARASNDSKEYRSSFDEPESSIPIHPRHFPHIDSDLSAPPSRASSQRKPKKSKLDFLRSEESKHVKNDTLRPGSSGSDWKRNSRQVSEELEEGTGLGSAIWAAQGAVKNLLGHRKNDSVSSLPSPAKGSRKDQREVKDPASAVTRFLKGVKHEGSKMGEIIFRRDRVDDSESDMESDHLTAPDSATDEDNKRLYHKRRPDISRTTTMETIGSVASKKNKNYHLDLPSFRSSYQSKIDEDTDSQLSDHPITRQDRERRSNRSPRFDQLAPPRMDLSRISSVSSRSSNQERINQLLARPGGVFTGLPVTALANSQTAGNSTNPHKSSRPTLDGKRHWSITDEDGNVLGQRAIINIVSQADIARVRALFLCSGIKAKEINRRALEVRERPAPFLINAAKSANVELYSVSKKEEHVLAARILVNAFEQSTELLQASTQTFRDKTVNELTSKITTLKSAVDSDLCARVRISGDEAVKITSWVSSEAPLMAKRISDDVDQMLRIRRRRMRWVRRIGWTLVEWMLLSFMWFIWLIVRLSRLVGGVFGFTWNVVKWLLWL